MSIEKIHLNNKGKVSDKWSSYLPFYDRTLAYLKEEKVSLLEVGVQNGGSLNTWATYFKSGRLFVGCDIDPKCGLLKYEDSRIQIVVGDVNTHEVFDQVCKLSGSFDVIIDDGSHRSPDILTTFIHYFPLLKPGGVYIIEDTHTLYMHGHFLGGLLNDNCAQKFFYKLADVINYEFWRNDIGFENYFSTFFMGNPVPSFISEGLIDEVAFRNSLITIHKSMNATHRKLGDRIVTGTSAIVNDSVLHNN